VVAVDHRDLTTVGPDADTATAQIFRRRAGIPFEVFPSLVKARGPRPVQSTKQKEALKTWPMWLRRNTIRSRLK
jgi:hypothetical protein